ncbi:hypothetical protein ABZV24_32845 [Streptomyces sp. NPDC005251]|uniref:hypothetical protein n=1 Tax=Streptomyces sp. NPDC005251 TaxID=3157166 RepID=UPI00339F26DF
MPDLREATGVVEALRVGPAEDSKDEVQRKRLATELRAAEAKLERQRRAATKMEQRIAEISKELGGPEGRSGD